MAANKNIKYINKDFNEFRASLIDYAKTYFPTTYNDFSPASPGMMFMEMAAYVGDVLSFYLDNQVQENYLQFARQSNNLFELAYMFGYKPNVTGVANTTIDFYQKVPSKLSGSVYIPANITSTSTSVGSLVVQGGLATAGLDNNFLGNVTIGGGVTSSYLLNVTGTANTGPLTATSFTGAGTCLTGTASSLSVGTATNIAGGTANQIHYQTGAGATSFITAPSNGTFLYYTTASGTRSTIS